MRAKVRVSSVDVQKSADGNVYGEKLKFMAVAKNESYPEDGSDENNTYAKFTPTATFELDVRNPALWGQFKPGDIYYVDFSEVQNG